MKHHEIIPSPSNSRSNMAESIETEERLKYLEFVQVAIAQALMCLAGIYVFAKENSGPLRPGVQSVERTVTSVVGPVVDIFHDAPFELLKFVDRKVDETVRMVERHVPEVVREASHKAYAAAQKAPEVAKSVAGEVQRSGVVATAVGMAKEAVARSEPVARELYGRYEPVAERQAVAACRALNRMPVFHQIAQIVVPTLAYSAEKYNRTVRYVAGQGYAVASYLPLVPIERIGKVFASDADDGEVRVEKEDRAAAVGAVEEEVPVPAHYDAGDGEKEAPVAAASQ